MKEYLLKVEIAQRTLSDLLERLFLIGVIRG